MMHKKIFNMTIVIISLFASTAVFAANTNNKIYALKKHKVVLTNKKTVPEADNELDVMLSDRNTLSVIEWDNMPITSIYKKLHNTDRIIDSYDIGHHRKIPNKSVESLVKKSELPLYVYQSETYIFDVKTSIILFEYINNKYSISYNLDKRDKVNIDTVIKWATANFGNYIKPNHRFLVENEDLSKMETYQFNTGKTLINISNSADIIVISYEKNSKDNLLYKDIELYCSYKLITRRKESRQVEMELLLNPVTTIIRNFSGNVLSGKAKFTPNIITVITENKLHNSDKYVEYYIDRVSGKITANTPDKIKIIGGCIPRN